ncbi:transporter substrate-binding domain-containing protein [Croceitalea sp. MTPC9]|uniref:transporter substrate-binding domain-containing protein n=1 Tax=unclassified Croceitalea TaxID=2632280 RepID=UPI002B3A9C61|nr:transporter substrate-binding domain-containing protein [Croceitalea sp. MTPC6]GMN15643.1 transporter substrate-binding domain-containing protein [Croceitalea sp. MTPC9]
MKRFFFVFALFLFCFKISAQAPTDTLIVGYAPAAPFIIEDDELLEGINIWLWKRVAEDLELPYTIKKMAFADMLAALKSGEIDVSINPLTITSDRIKELGFTRSFFASHSTVAVAEKSSFQKIKQFLGAIFQMNFLRGFLLLFVILLFFGFLTWLFERRHNPNDFRPGQKGIWDGLWWSVVTLTTVGYGDKAPKTRWGKIAALGLMLSGLLFVSGLTASIASSLTVNQLTENVESFDEFKERPVGTVRSSSSYDFLRVHFFKDINQYNSVVPGLQDLNNQKIEAFIYDEPILKYRIRKDSTLAKLQLLPIKFDVQFYAFGINKDSLALQRRISQRILEIIETTEWEVVLAEYGLTEI